MPNVLVTQQGMEFITSAHDDGVFIYLKYFVPVYDNRIDGTIRSSQLSSFAQVADSSLTVPFGEILWKQSSSAAYTLSNNTSYVISANAIVSNTVPNSYQSSRSYTNLLNGIPLSNQVSASGWNISQSGAAGTYTWSGTNVTGITGSNIQPAGIEGYFQVADYYTVYDTSAEGDARGSFKCVIDELIGNVKFNKLALYAVAITNGVESEVKFFGEAYLGSTPAIRSNLGIGYDRFEWDIQIDVSGVSASFEDLFFSSSADYWSHSPGGLYYPGKIGVGNFVDDQKTIAAAMHVRKPRDTFGAVQTSTPILRLDYNTSAYATLDITQKGVYTNLNVAGDVVLRGPTGFDPYSDGTFALRPYEINAIALGTSAKPFTELWLFHEQEDSVVPVRALLNIHPYWDVGIRVWQGTYPFDVDEDSEYQVEIGQGSQVGYLNSHAIKINNFGILIESNNGNADVDDLLFTSKGFLKGADIWRQNQNLYIYSVIDESVESKDICLIAGFSTDALATFSHNNILNTIEDNYLLDVRNQSEGYGSLLERANIRMVALGRIGLYSSHVELRQLRQAAYGTALLTTEMQGDSYAGITSKLFIGSYLNGEELTPEIIGARVLSIDTSYSNGTIPGDDLSFIDSDWLLDNGGESSIASIYLITGKIWVDSHISPIANARWSLGFEGQWKSLFAKTIQVGINKQNLENGFNESGVFTNTINNYNYIGGLVVHEQVYYSNVSGHVNRYTKLYSFKTNDDRGDTSSFVTPNKTRFSEELLDLGLSDKRINKGYFIDLNSQIGNFTSYIITPTLTSTNIYFTGDTLNGAALTTYRSTTISTILTYNAAYETAGFFTQINLSVTRIGNIVTIGIPHTELTAPGGFSQLRIKEPSSGWPSWMVLNTIEPNDDYVINFSIYARTSDINSDQSKLVKLRWYKGDSVFYNNFVIDDGETNLYVIDKIYATSVTYHIN
jgi:hypothetical protein